MNILLINHYAGSDYHGMEYRPFYFAREWVKLGHNVIIVAASYSHLRTKNPLIKKHITEEKIEGINYLWVKTNKYKGNGIGRIINMLTFCYRLFFCCRKFINEFMPDVVIASSTYPLDIYPAYWFTKKNSSRLIFEVHDLWPLSPIELGNMSKWNPLIIIMQIAENFAYKKSFKVVSLLPKTKSYMQEHGMNPEKFEYIPNGTNLIDWKINHSELPKEHFEILTKLRNNNHFLVAYTGAHGIANALHNFIDAAKKMENCFVTFILIGQGQEKEKLMKRTKALNLKNILFLQPVSKSAMPALLNFMDVLYIGLKAEPLFRFGVSPNKLLDYMMAAKPVIHAIEAGNDIVSESECGISVPSENPDAIVEAVFKIMNMSQNDRTKMGNNGRKYVEKEHDYIVLANHFLNIMVN